MQIIRNDEAAYFTFAPTNEEEVAVLQSVIALAKPEDRMKYGGRSGGDDGEPLMISLHVGLQTEEVRGVEGRVTSISHKQVGGVELKLLGTTETDDTEKYAASAMQFILVPAEQPSSAPVRWTAKRPSWLLSRIASFAMLR